MRTLQSNVVFRHLETSNKRIVIEQGGTRSGKTYNILLWIIFSYALNDELFYIKILQCNNMLLQL